MKRFLLYAILIVGALIFLYPFVWMLAATLKPETEIAGFRSILRHTSRSRITVSFFHKIPIIRGFRQQPVGVASL